MALQFVCVENVLSGACLARVQAAWARVEAPCKAAWMRARQHSRGISRHAFQVAGDGQPPVTRKYFTPVGTGEDEGRPFLELDPAFLDLVHNDQSPGSDEARRVAERILVGPHPDNPDDDRRELGSEERGDGVRGELRCTGVNPRVYVADADGEGYCESPDSRSFLGHSCR